MKFQIVSDLHLEFNKKIKLTNETGADVLILAGDICVADHLHKNPPNVIDVHGNVRDLSDVMINTSWYAKDAQRYREFFNQVSNEFDTVIYIMGNHEHYRGRWNDTAAHLREALEPWHNIVFLDDAWINLNGIRIIGTTLWTSLNNYDPLTMLHIKDGMTDYRAITIHRDGIYHKLRPIDTANANRDAVSLIKEGVSTWDGPVVVVGHHAPSWNSIHPTYKDQHFMNAAFVNKLDEYIIDHPQIKLWVHGHVHNPWDYMIGETRIVCNPHGYPDERSSWDPNFIVEIQGENK